MKKTLYIILLVVEAASLFLPLFFVLYFEGLLVSILALAAIAAVYALFGFRARKQKKAPDTTDIIPRESIIKQRCYCS